MWNVNNNNNKNTKTNQQTMKVTSGEEETHQRRVLEINVTPQFHSQLCASIPNTRRPVQQTVQVNHKTVTEFTVVYGNQPFKTHLFTPTYAALMSVIRRYLGTANQYALSYITSPPNCKHVQVKNDRSVVQFVNTPETERRLVVTNIEKRKTSKPPPPPQQLVYRITLPTTHPDSINSMILKLTGDNDEALHDYLVNRMVTLNSSFAMEMLLNTTQVLSILERANQLNIHISVLAELSNEDWVKFRDDMGCVVRPGLFPDPDGTRRFYVDDGMDLLKQDGNHREILQGWINQAINRVHREPNMWSTLYGMSIANTGWDWSYYNMCKSCEGKWLQELVDNTSLSLSSESESVLDAYKTVFFRAVMTSNPTRDDLIARANAASATTTAITQPLKKTSEDPNTFSLCYENIESQTSLNRFNMTLGKDKFTDAQVSINCLPRKHVDNMSLLKTEVEVLRAVVGHPNILALQNVCHDVENFYLVYEFVEGMELFDSIVAREFYTEPDARHVLNALAEAILYCHSKGVVHRDIKPENIYLTGMDCKDVKLASFGFAKRLKDGDDMLTSTCGTPGYVAPEILARKTYGCTVDMWSFGVVAYILFCGYPPFYAENMRDQFAKIKSGVFVFDEPYWNDISEFAKDLVSKCLVLDTTQRYTARQALDHAWMKGDV